MGNEPPCISLETYLLALREADRLFFEERDRRYAELAVERQRAINLAMEDLKAWREQANEWRGAMLDKDRLLARADAVDSLATRVDKMEGKSNGINAGWVLLAGALGLAAAIGSLLLQALKGQ